MVKIVNSVGLVWLKEESYCVLNIMGHEYCQTEHAWHISYWLKEIFLMFTYKIQASKDDVTFEMISLC